MKRTFLAVLVTLLIVIITLAAVFTLVRATLDVAAMTNPILRAVAIGVELVLGVLLLVGTVYLATRLAVRIYGGGPPRNL